MENERDSHPKRTEFLIEYYKVLWGNINRHIQGVWRTVTTLGGSLALLTLVGNGVVSYSWAIALIIGLCAWYAATIYDSALWFSRNQVIATNIEQLFLSEPDKNKIQPYFESHRDEPLISHFKIALWLSRGFVSTLILYHAVEIVVPSLKMGASFSVPKAVPYAFLILYVIVECRKGSSIRSRYDHLTRMTDSSSQKTEDSTVPHRGQSGEV